MALLLGVATMAVAGAACAAPAPTPTPTKPAAAPATPAATAVATKPAAAGATVGAGSEQARPLYASACAPCHGDKGQGVTAPALWGDTPRLTGFSTARQLYDYLRGAMPMNRPGSLTEEQYTQLTALLLMENRYAEPSTPFSTAALDTLRMQR